MERPEMSQGPAVRDYLKFLRLDSASASMIFSLLGFTLAGGNPFGFVGLAWLLFGLIFHAAGYADNNIQDYKYDVSDTNKAGFPLGRSISFHGARSLTLGLHIVGLVSAIVLAGSVTSLSVFLFAYVLGLVYNRRNKVWKFAPVFFSLTFALLALFSYYSTNGAISGSIVAVCALAFLESVFQNGISTTVKDIEYDGLSVIKSLGARVTMGRLEIPSDAVYLGMSFKVMEILPLALLFAWTLSVVSLLVVPLMAIGFYGAFALLRGGPWEYRSRLMLYAAIGELGTYYSVIAVLAPQLGVWGALFFVFFPLSWYVVVKKLLWGTVLELRA